MRTSAYIFVFLLSTLQLVGQTKEQLTSVVTIHPKKKELVNSYSSKKNKAKPQTQKGLVKKGTEVAARTHYTLGVSKYGGIQYEIPMMVPKGIRNVAPRLRLSYNSQGGDGIAGWGWSLEGLSTISRVRATLHHDGFIDPVDFDENDRFSLDGQRLLLKSGIYGQAGSTYQTENFSNLQIVLDRTFKSEGQTHPNRFFVYYPDGSKATYSYSSVLYFPMTRWEDNEGNTIVYRYTNPKGLPLIESIHYGAKSSDSAKHPNSMVFHYEEATPKNWNLINQQQFYYLQRLKEIQIHTEGTQFRAYDLEYETTTSNHDRISKITESSADELKPPLTFSYASTSDILVQEEYPITIEDSSYSLEHSRILSGDYNGDGVTDHVEFGKSTPSSLKWFLSDGDDLNVYTVPLERDAETKFWEALLVNYQDRDSRLYSRNALTLVHEELVRSPNYSSALPDNLSAKLHFRTFAVDATGNTVVQYRKEWEHSGVRKMMDCGTINSAFIPKKYLSGDFNGDGIQDIFMVEQPHVYENCNIGSYGSQDCRCNPVSINRSEAFFVDMNRRKSTDFVFPLGILPNAVRGDDQIRTGDFDGDGKMDIYHFQSDRFYVYRINKDNQLEVTVKQNITPIDSDTPVILGDFNGDGKTDVLNPLNYNNSDWWYLYYANGKTFSFSLVSGSDLVYHKNIHESPGKKIWGFVRALFDSNAPLVSSRNYIYIPQDIDGDGITDIIQQERDLDYKRIYGKDNVRIDMHIKTFLNRFDSNGQPDFKLQGTYYSLQILPFEESYGTILSIDSGNLSSGLTFSYLMGNTIFHNHLKNNHQQEVLIQEIAQKDIRHHIEYEGLSVKEESTYLQDYSQFYPYVNRNAAQKFPLVKQITTQENGRSYFQQYRYRGAVTHINGLGFLGFKAVASTNRFGSGVRKLWQVTEYEPELRGAVTKRWNSSYGLLEEPNSLFDKTEYEYTTHSLSNGVFVNKTRSRYTENRLTVTTQLQTHTYDAYYNPTRVLTEYFSEGTKEAFEDIRIEYDNQPNPEAADFHIGRLRKEERELNRDGNQLLNKREYIKYRGSLPQIIKVTAGGDESYTEKRNYDSYGNLIELERSSPGLPKQKESYAYTADGRLLEKRTNSKNETTLYDYNNAGGLEKETSPLGRDTQYTYDGFQRPITQTNYLDQTDRITYKWSGDKIEKHTRFALGGEQKEREDRHGQWWHRGEKKGSRWRWSSRSFDLAGNLIRLSEPYWATEPSLNKPGTQYTYDGYGRLSQTQKTSGEKEIISYSVGQPKRELSGTHPKRTDKLDAMGSIRERSDPGGTLRFQYHTDGQLQSSQYAGHTLTSQQNIWGFKKQLNDPSAGDFGYTTNAWGQTTQQTTPWGTTTSGYTDQGLLDWKEQKGDHTDRYTTYRYTTDTGQLSERSSTDSYNTLTHTVQYSYDTHNRPIRMEESTDKAGFAQELEYDSQGRIARETRTIVVDGGGPESVTVAYEYDTEGDMIGINYNQQKIWERLAINARGQATQIRLGNGLTESRSYNQAGYLSKVTAGTALQLQLHYDSPKGVLRQKKQGETTTLYENDEQQRLTQVRESSRVQQFEYDEFSRLKENPDVGESHYNNPKDRYVLDSLYLNAKGVSYYSNHRRQTATYDIDRKAVEIAEEGHARASFVYDCDGQRIAAYYGSEAEAPSQRPKATYYSSQIPTEITHTRTNGKRQVVHFIGGDAYSAPLALINGKVHYLHRDHLASIISISDANGTVLEKRYFGPWGQIEQVQLSTGALISTTSSATQAFAESLLSRGFTGHEHFPMLGLIHMNGRVYDPMLKRFLAPDSQIFDPYDSRAYDRFAYVANNPMMMLDPSGEKMFIAFFIALAASYVITGLYDLIVTDKWEWDPSKRTLPFGLNINADLDRIHDSSQGGLNPSGSGSGGFSESGNFTITADNLPTHVPANLTFVNQQTVETVSPPSGPCDWVNSPENCQGLEGTSFSVANTTYNGGSGYTNSESSNASEAADGEDDTEITPSVDCAVGDANCDEANEDDDENQEECPKGQIPNGNGGCIETPFDTSSLSDYEERELLESIKDLLDKCLGKALLNSINSVNVITDDLPLGNVAQYRAYSNSIVFNQNSIGDGLGAELFHSYQQQVYGTLVDISNSNSGHIGGSNIEFEEKAFTVLMEKIETEKNVIIQERTDNNSGASVYGGFVSSYNIENELLFFWINDLYDNNINEANVSLTPKESASWFEALQVFKDHHFQANGCGNGDMYGCPIDLSVQPNALLSVFNKALMECIN